MPKYRSTYDPTKYAPLPLDGDPLTNEIIMYDRTHCPVRDTRQENTHIFGGLLALIGVLFAVFLIAYFTIYSRTARIVCLILTLVSAAGLVALISWYVTFMVKSIKPYKEENEAIAQWIRERLMRAAEEKKGEENLNVASDNGNPINNEWLNK